MRVILSWEGGNELLLSHWGHSKGGGRPAFCRKYGRWVDDLRFPSLSQL